MAESMSSLVRPVILEQTASASVRDMSLPPALRSRSSSHRRVVSTCDGIQKGTPRRFE